MANIKIKDGYAVSFNVSDEDSTDFVEYFKTLEQAKKFAAAILRNDDDESYDLLANDDYSRDYEVDEIEKDTIKIFKVQLIGKPKVEITLTFDE